MNSPSLASWSIHGKLLAYSNAAKRCDLCLAKKLANVLADKGKSLTEEQNFSPSAGTRTNTIFATILHQQTIVWLANSPPGALFLSLVR